MSKKFLHVGCGSQTKSNTTPVLNSDDWEEVRLDIDDKVNPDIVADLIDMSVIDDSSYDAVYSHHNLEHLFLYQVPIALKEINRVLKDDGYLVVSCPDIQSVCKAVAEGNLVNPLYISNAGPISAIDILYGLRSSLAKGNHYMAHNVGFTKELLHQILTDCGFKSTIVAAWAPSYVLWGIAYKNLQKSDDELYQDLKSHTSHSTMQL